MDNFSKLYLISPESYNKLIHDKLIRQGLDHEMYNIIAMKKISDSEKWYLYRQQLVKFANKSRHNELGKPIGEKIMQNNNKKNLFDVGSQTNRIRRPVIHQANKTRVTNSEIATQTDSPMMDESAISFTSTDYDSADNSFEIEDSLHTPVLRSRAKLVKKLNFEDEKRKSINDSKRPLLKRSATLPGTKSSPQTMLNFPVIKKPRLTRATSKAMGQQTGGNRIKWSCMK